MPPIVQSCFQSLCSHAGNHLVHLITQENISKYVTIPDYILRKVQEGKISFTHFSDILRMCLLYEHGGLWIDATVYVSEPIPEKVFQEALLNALSHRDYQSQGAVYVKHYPDKIVIENPGAFLDGITENNIITHPSVPRNKLIAETLQHLKYVQRTGQGVDIIFREMISSGKPFPEYKSYNDAVSLTIYSAIDDIDFVKFIANEENGLSRSFSLSELMILRYLKDNRKITMSEAESLIQEARDQAQNACNNLKRYGLIELSGNEYMLTAKIYDELKNSVDYTKDKAIQYIKAREMILEYIRDRGFINNELVRELCGFSQKQARIILQRMRKENLIELSEKGRYAKYIIKK